MVDATRPPRASRTPGAAAAQSRTVTAAAESTGAPAAAQGKPAVKSATAPRRAANTARAVKAAKSARAQRAGKSSPAAKADKVAKPRKNLVRDSFSMPREDFDLIDALKARALEVKRVAKKSELLRAGLHALNILEAAALAVALDRLMPVKTGRPKKKD